MLVIVPPLMNRFRVTAVALFAESAEAESSSTAPLLTGPGLPGDPRHQLLQAAAPCSPCFRRVCPIDFRCMTGIHTDRVVDAVGRAIALG